MADSRSLVCKLFPFDRFDLFSHELPGDLARRLSGLIEAPSWGRVKEPHGYFQGTVSETGFRVSEIIHYRNTFLPRICGRFERINGGTRVSITMRLAIPVVIFYSAAFASLSFASVMVALAMWFDGRTNYTPLIVCAMWATLLAMMTCFWILACVGFWYAADKNRRQLTRLIELGEFKPDSNDIGIEDNVFF